MSDRTQQRVSARHATALSLAALACGLLTACGVAEAASNPSTPAPAPAQAAAEAARPAARPAAARTASKPAQATRSHPQLRLDSSEAEVRKFRAAYAGCLHEHGMPTKGTWSKAAEKSARAACEHLRPLLPPELDPAKNPDYAKSVRVEAKCLQDHGFDVHLVKAPAPAKLGWRYGSVPGDDVDITKIQNDCRVKAFGGGRAIQPGPQ